MPGKRQNRQRFGPEVEAAAELLYVVNARTKQEVMQLTGISSTTFSRWAKKHDWDGKRGLEIISIPATVRMMRADIARTYKKAEAEDRPLNSGERDGVYKTLLQIAKLDKGGSLFASHAIRAMDLFVAYLREVDGELLERLTPSIVEFTSRLAKQHIA